MGSIGETVDLAAGVAEVWKYITDPAHFREWIDGYDEGEVVTANQTGMGSGFRWYGRIGPMRLESSEEVIEWKDCERVSYQGSMAGIEFVSFMAVTPSNLGGTHLEIGIEYSVPLRFGGSITDRLFLNRLFKNQATRSLVNLQERFGKPGTSSVKVTA